MLFTHKCLSASTLAFMAVLRRWASFPRLREAGAGSKTYQCFAHFLPEWPEDGKQFLGRFVTGKKELILYSHGLTL
jgi:hypothetical protein